MAAGVVLAPAAAGLKVPGPCGAEVKQAKAMLGAGLQDGSLEKVLVNQQIQSNSCG